MAERISFLFGIPRKVSASTQDAKPSTIVEFNATLSEDHNISAELTDHPVETGSTITDHYRLLPKSITINGIVSNTPLSGLNPLAIGAGLVAGVVTSVNSRISKSPANEAYDKIEASMKKGELLTIVTTLKTYNNMLITSFSTRRDSASGNILNATIVLREVRIAKVETISTPEKPANEKDKPFENQGQKEKIPATANQSNNAAAGKSSVINAF